ncbi:MAG: 50S ribosomal protein L4 [Bacteroidetes bacterium]|nr:50S ribosomal protein L4 [Bacteroidota bacterium]
MNVQVYTTTGTKSEEVALNEAVFGIEPNAHVVYQAVRIHLGNKRQGTSKSKERADVRGGGRKPWRQKGRGTARAGTTRSPLWVGGGTIFGPRPRDYRKKLPLKMRQLARKSAFAMKAVDQQIMVVEDFTIESAKTRDVAALLKALSLEGTKTLLVVAEYDQSLWLAGRNIPTLEIREASKASTYDVLNNQMLLIQKSALPVIEAAFTKI